MKILFLKIFAISLLHFGLQKKCTLKSLKEVITVKIIKKYHAITLGNGNNEPDLPFDYDNLITNLMDNVTECGKPVIDISEAIINGQEAVDKAWPWQVFLSLKNRKNERAVCGGSLISESWVITAAHCLIGYDFRMVLGAENRDNLLEQFEQNNSSIQFRAPEKVIIHKRYESDSVSDIALVKLDTAAVFNDQVQPICLPKPGQKFDESFDGDCYKTGWGRRNFSQPSSPILYQIKVKIMPQSLCIYSYALLGGRYDGRFICLDLNDDESGTCFGDSGGPLACKVDGRFVLAGITHAVPTKYNCSFAFFPALDARVTEYLDWIAINIEENE